MPLRPPRKWAGLGVPPRSFEGVDTFRLEDQELPLMDSVVVERTRISGTPLDFFVQDSVHSTRNLYGDESKVWRGPYPMMCNATWPEKSPEATEQGGKATWQAEVWVPRKFFEDSRLPPPRVGDIIRVWNLPYYREFGQADDTEDQHKKQKSGYFFTLDKVDDKGHVHDTGSFVGFNLTVKRDTDFTPERIVFPDAAAPAVPPPSRKISPSETIYYMGGSGGGGSGGASNNLVGTGTAAVALALGAPVCVLSDERLGAPDGSEAAAAAILGISMGSYQVGQAATYAASGGLVSGLSNLTPSTEFWAGPGGALMIWASVPSGWWTRPMAVAASSTTLRVQIGPVVQKP